MILTQCNFTSGLKIPLKDLPIGTYGVELSTASMDSPVYDVIHIMSKRGVSAVPIVDSKNICLNIFEAVDVLQLIETGTYHDLEITVGEALLRRSDDFAGVPTCTEDDTLDTIFDAIRKTRLHRLVIVGPNNELKGMLTHSDILGYIL